MEKSEINYFVRTLIVLFVIFLLVIVSVSFFNTETIFSITSGMITILALATILILSEAFDNLSLGKIFSLSRKVEEVKADRDRVQKENIELRNSLVQVATNVQSQVNATIHAPGLDLGKLFDVTKASEVEKEQKVKKEEDLEELTDTKPIIDTELIITNKIPSHKIFRSIEPVALKKYLSINNINESIVMHDVRFTTAFSGLDPIMETSLIFDGYIKGLLEETFIDIKVYNSFVSVSLDRLYIMLSKILFYRQAKKISASLNLILVKLPEDIHPIRRLSNLDRLYEQFQPAISNDLLKIIVIEITKEEYEDVVNTLDKDTENRSN